MGFKNFIARLFPAYFGAITSYSVVVYLMLSVILGVFFTRCNIISPLSIAFMAGVVICFPLLYLAPSILFNGILLLGTVRAADAVWRRRLILSSVVVWGFLTQLLLMIDLGIFSNYGFHFGFFILNLITVPGGIASMGLRSGTVCTVLGGVLILLAFHVGMMLLFRKYTRLNFLFPMFKSFRNLIWMSVWTAAFLFVIFSYGYEHFMFRPAVLKTAEAVPFFQPVTMKSFFKNLGLKQPDRDLVTFSDSSNASLNYPLEEIKRNNDRKKYNVVWLVGESWRADMLNPKVMPTTSKFAEKAVNFKNHYSGGNGTRTGMFSMFYGLYGNYWHDFLKNGRGPVFIDWLLEDNYQFRCISSAKFTYPEFDKTIFARVQSKDMSSDDRDRTYTRDQRNIVLLKEFIANTKADQPFFAFMFFESPHAPYEFPPESVIEQDYYPDINYTTVTKSDGPRILNRYKNSCHHLDQCFAEILQLLEDKKLLDNTIVVITGDHGEEFYEKGRLGHNSTFVKEQTNTPLVIYIPGVKPFEYTKMSSHLDIVPMLAPFFGVDNESEDFSLGYNLLDDDNERTYSILAGWSNVAYTGRDYKTILPQNAVEFA
ncbi:MAG: sulfatase-like hydrolase/transferase, partial [Victivallaceae bacterium]